MPTLFSPIRLGSIDCKNRIIMAPLTRAHATKDGVPTKIMIDYYQQRADAGMIISEAVGISRQGLGWINAPGIWNEEQIKAWTPITEAVHKKGGKITCQLWHMGRCVHSATTGEQPISPSGGRPPEGIYIYQDDKPVKVPYEESRPVKIEEIPAIITDYANAAKNAIKAGFDGVQIHSANGYLLDEFLRDGTNHRQDRYGGSIENRMRLLKEVTKAVIDAIGADKVGVRLSPNGDCQGCIDSDPDKTFVAVAKMLQDLDIAWLGMREADIGDIEGDFRMGEINTQEKVSPKIRQVFTNPLILNQNYSEKKAEDTIESGLADAISFGRDFISNPDLVRRFKDNLPLTKDDPQTWYGIWHGEKGYTDYPDYEK